LILVSVFNQQCNNAKDILKKHTYPQNHTKIQSVILLIIKGLIKVPGKYSGFLAADATRAARNANICLVP
jgi:hypothetical protein